jgi:hypothetical protein
MRHIDHIRYAPYSFGYGHVVVVNAHKWISNDRRTKKIIWFEVTDRFPQRCQQIGRELQTSLARRISVWQPQESELVTANTGGRFLLFQPDSRCIFAGAKMVASRSIGAHNDTAREIAS